LNGFAEAVLSGLPFPIYTFHTTLHFPPLQEAKAFAIGDEGC